jgi:dextranase
MAKNHINTVQFYDWSYRPDMLVAPDDRYADLMGKQNSLGTVKTKIAQCHEYGMRAVGYGAIYAASEQYRSDHPDQSLFAGSDAPLCFIGKFYIMNISRESAWHDHIIAEYKHAAALMGFGGFHMDTYGFPKTALDVDGQVVYLEEHINELIEDTRIALQAANPEPCLIFNNVGGWPVEITKQAQQECVYIEVWPPCDRYHHLKQLILDAKSTGKPVVLAAYPAPFREDTKERALESELLCALAIGLNGATQLFIGEHNAVITQGYYADYTRLDHDQIKKIRAYQDFLVQYEELLLDDTLKDVSFTHIGWDNVEYACDAEYSVSGEAGKLWLTVRENKNIKLIGMVNLSGNDDLWNTGKEKPKDLYNVTFSVLTPISVSRVCFASPDINGGLAAELDFTTKMSDKGELTMVTIPHIAHGGLLWMEV